MAKNKPYDELNAWCLDLIESRLRDLKEAKLVAKEIGVKDGTLSKWRSGQQRIRADCVDRILSLYAGLPLELLKMFPKEHLHVLIKEHQIRPNLINLIVEIIKKGDERLLNHLENQIDLLINPPR